MSWWVATGRFQIAPQGIAHQGNSGETSHEEWAAWRGKQKNKMEEKQAGVALVERASL